MSFIRDGKIGRFSQLDDGCGDWTTGIVLIPQSEQAEFPIGVATLKTPFQNASAPKSPRNLQQFTELLHLNWEASDWLYLIRVRSQIVYNRAELNSC